MRWKRWPLKGAYTPSRHAQSPHPMAATFSFSGTLASASARSSPACVCIQRGA